MPVTEIFSVAEARAFDKLQLASVVDYPDATIEAKEEEIREELEHICRVNFIPTSHTDTLDGDGSDYLILPWPKITEVTAISIDGEAVDAAYLNASDYEIGLAIDGERGLLTSRGFSFTAGWQNVVITYTAGWATPPKAIKRAALMWCVNELPSNNAPWQADGYDAGGTSYSFARGDGFNGNWSSLPEVQKAIRMYTLSMPGVA